MIDYLLGNSERDILSDAVYVAFSDSIIRHGGRGYRNSQWQISGC